MDKTLKLSVLLPVESQILYDAWMNSHEHSLFTGSGADIDNRIGGKFTAWDGYIEGTTLELHPCSKIVQSWRTTQFPEDAPDSRLEIILEPAGTETLLSLFHTGIPEGQEDGYEQGWNDYYFEPMKNYYTSK
ncbi:MAG: SRPBCC family protein [Eubacteriales bacterium]